MFDVLSVIWFFACLSCVSDLLGKWFSCSSLWIMILLIFGWWCYWLCGGFVWVFACCVCLWYDPLTVVQI